MLITLAILLFVGWLATYFFAVSGILTYALLAAAALCIIIHFILLSRRRPTGPNPL